jgi:hypothetical protein
MRTHAIDRLHDRLRRSSTLFRVVLATRCLFAMAFAPTGLVKLLGLPFTAIPRRRREGEARATGRD